MIFVGGNVGNPASLRSQTPSGRFGRSPPLKPAVFNPSSTTAPYVRWSTCPKSVGFWALLTCHFFEVVGKEKSGFGRPSLWSLEPCRLAGSRAAPASQRSPRGSCGRPPSALAPAQALYKVRKPRRFAQFLFLGSLDPIRPARQRACLAGLFHLASPFCSPFSGGHVPAHRQITDG